MDDLNPFAGPRTGLVRKQRERQELLKIARSRSEPPRGRRRMHNSGSPAKYGTRDQRGTPARTSKTSSPFFALRRILS